MLYLHTMPAVTKLRPKKLPKGKSSLSIVTYKGKTKVVAHGAKGAKVRPGTSKGDGFCSRHPANTHKRIAARAAWNCKGKKSMKKRPAMYNGKHNQKKVNEALRRRGMKAKSRRRKMRRR